MTRAPKEPTSLQRARKAHADRMKAAGFKPKTFWLSKESAEALALLTPHYNNESMAINAALVGATKTPVGLSGSFVRYEDPPRVEVVLRDGPTVDQIIASNAELLLDMETREPVGLRVLTAAPKRPAKPSETAEGRRANPKPPKTAEQASKGSGEPVSQTVGISVQVGPVSAAPGSRLKKR